MLSVSNIVDKILLSDKPEKAITFLKEEEFEILNRSNDSNFVHNLSSKGNFADLL